MSGLKNEGPPAGCPANGPSDLCMAELREVRVNQNRGRFRCPANTGAFPGLDVRDPGVSDTAALLKGEVPSEHRRNDGFPPHALLFPNLLYTQPASGLAARRGTGSRIVTPVGQ